MKRFLILTIISIISFILISCGGGGTSLTSTDDITQQDSTQTSSLSGPLYNINGVIDLASVSSSPSRQAASILNLYIEIYDNSGNLDTTINADANNFYAITNLTYKPSKMVVKEGTLKLGEITLDDNSDDSGNDFVEFKQKVKIDPASKKVAYTAYKMEKTAASIKRQVINAIGSTDSISATDIVKSAQNTLTLPANLDSALITKITDIVAKEFEAVLKKSFGTSEITASTNLFTDYDLNSDNPDTTNITISSGSTDNDFSDLSNLQTRIQNTSFAIDVKDTYEIDLSYMKDNNLLMVRDLNGKIFKNFRLRIKDDDEIIDYFDIVNGTVWNKDSSNFNNSENKIYSFEIDYPETSKLTAELYFNNKYYSLNFNYNAASDIKSYSFEGLPEELFTDSRFDLRQLVIDLTFTDSDTYEITGLSDWTASAGSIDEYEVLTTPSTAGTIELSVYYGDETKCTAEVYVKDLPGATEQTPIKTNLFMSGAYNSTYDSYGRHFGMVKDTAENALYLTSYWDMKITKIDLTTGAEASGFPKSLPNVDRPHGLAVSASAIYVADLNNHAIRKYSKTDMSQIGVYTFSGQEQPVNLTVYNGKLYIADRFLDQIIVLNEDLTSPTTFPIPEMDFSAVDYVDLVVYEDRLYIVSNELSCIVSMDLDGTNISFIRVKGITELENNGLKAIGINIKNDRIYVNAGGSEYNPVVYVVNMQGELLNMWNIDAPSDTNGSFIGTYMDIEFYNEDVYVASHNDHHQSSAEQESSEINSYSSHILYFTEND